MKDHVLHLTCPNCKDTDLVFASKAKEWMCPFCHLQDVKPLYTENPVLQVLHRPDGTSDYTPLEKLENVVINEVPNITIKFSPDMLTKYPPFNGVELKP